MTSALAAVSRSMLSRDPLRTVALAFFTLVVVACGPAAHVAPSSPPPIAAPHRASTCRLSGSSAAAVLPFRDDKPLPDARRTVAVAVDSHGDVFVIGGFGSPPGQALSRKIWRTTIGSAASWVEIGNAPGVITAARVEGSRLYVFGGTVWSAPIGVDGALGSFTVAGALPPSVDARPGAVVVTHRRVYLVGGRLNDPTVRVAPLRGDGTLGPWTETSPLPRGREGHVVVARDRDLYLVGGVVWPYDKKQANGGYDRKDMIFLDDVLHARVQKDGRLSTWKRVGTLSGRIDHAVAVVDDALVVVGGQQTIDLDDRVFVAPFNPNGTVDRPRVAARAAILEGNHAFSFGGYATVGTDLWFFGTGNIASDRTRVLSLKELEVCGE